MWQPECDEHYQYCKPNIDITISTLGHAAHAWTHLVTAQTLLNPRFNNNNNIQQNKIQRNNDHNYLHLNKNWKNYGCYVQ